MERVNEREQQQQQQQQQHGPSKLETLPVPFFFAERKEAGNIEIEGMFVNRTL